MPVIWKCTKIEKKIINITSEAIKVWVVRGCGKRPLALLYRLVRDVILQYGIKWDTKISLRLWVTWVPWSAARRKYNFELQITLFTNYLDAFDDNESFTWGFRASFTVVSWYWCCQLRLIWCRWRKLKGVSVGISCASDVLMVKAISQMVFTAVAVSRVVLVM